MPTTDPSTLSHHLSTMIAVLHGGYARILPDVLHVGLLLLTLDAVLMGLWWALDGGENFLSRLVRWILCSGLTVQQFLDPMAVFQHGWELCVVIMAAWATHMGLSAALHPGDMFMMGLAFLGILLAHFLLAAEVFLTVLEFTLLTICSTILLPFGFLRYTWFLCEMAIKNLVVLSVRLLVLAAVVSLITPVMTQLLLPSQPTLKDAFGAAIIAGMCALLAWHAPHMAASMVGGVAILTGQATIRTVQTAVQVATLGTVQ